MTARPWSISLRGLAVFWFMSGRGSGLADGVGSRADVQQVLCAASRGRSGRPGALRLPALCCGRPLLFYTNQRPDYLTMCAVGEHIHRREALGAVAFLGQESEVAGHRLRVAADVDDAFRGHAGHALEEGGRRTLPGRSMKTTSAFWPASAASRIHAVASAAKKRAFFTPLCFALPMASRTASRFTSTPTTCRACQRPSGRWCRCRSRRRGRLLCR